MISMTSQWLLQWYSNVDTVYKRYKKNFTNCKGKTQGMGGLSNLQMVYKNGGSYSGQASLGIKMESSAKKLRYLRLFMGRQASCWWRGHTGAEVAPVAKVIAEVADGVAAIKDLVAVAAAETISVKVLAEVPAARFTVHMQPISYGAFGCEGFTNQGCLWRVISKEATSGITCLHQTGIKALLHGTSATKLITYPTAATITLWVPTPHTRTDNRERMVVCEERLTSIVHIHLFQEVEAREGLLLLIIKAIVEREDIHLNQGHPAIHGLTYDLSLHSCNKRRKHYYNFCICNDWEWN